MSINCSTLNEDIISALCAPQATISPKYFYDVYGSALFERITRLPEYYPTRTEQAIMLQHGAQMARHIAAETTVVELGAGNCEKARSLCALLQAHCFVAVDISADFLYEAVDGLRCALPGLDIRTLVADLNDDITLPDNLPPGPRLVFYPGSSIGNFDPEPALVLLRRMRGLLQEDGALLIGVDLIKDHATLEAAYNDADGVTAAFNLNALTHLNRLIGSNFELSHWQHRAWFNREQSRIEMYLQAVCDVAVAWQGGERFFRSGELIHTENSYKYDIDAFTELLDAAGFQQARFWTDPSQWFGVFLAQA